jgi:hypothetical protein
MRKKRFLRLPFVETIGHLKSSFEKRGSRKKTFEIHFFQSSKRLFLLATTRKVLALNTVEGIVSVISLAESKVPTNTMSQQFLNARHSKPHSNDATGNQCRLFFPPKIEKF